MRRTPHEKREAPLELLTSNKKTVLSVQATWTGNLRGKSRSEAFLAAKIFSSRNATNIFVSQQQFAKHMTAQRLRGSETVGNGMQSRLFRSRTGGNPERRKIPRNPLQECPTMENLKIFNSTSISNGAIKNSLCEMT